MRQERIFEESENLCQELLRDSLIVDLLETLREHEESSYHHSVRVAKYAIELGYLTDNIGSLVILGKAGLFHDIGKLEISREILQKRGALTAEERTIIERHPRIGYDMMKRMNVDDDICQIILLHHEFQSKPYARSGVERRGSFRLGRERRMQVSSEKVELVALADLYDALTSRRSYKPRFTVEQTAQTILLEYKGDEKYIPLILSVKPLK